METIQILHMPLKATPDSNVNVFLPDAHTAFFNPSIKEKDEKIAVYTEATQIHGKYSQDTNLSENCRKTHMNIFRKMKNVSKYFSDFFV